MGNCAEERGVIGLVDDIMGHKSMIDRDAQTQQSLRRALLGKTPRQLLKIRIEIDSDGPLSDNFS